MMGLADAFSFIQLYSVPPSFLFLFKMASRMRKLPEEKTKPISTFFPKLLSTSNREGKQSEGDRPTIPSDNNQPSTSKKTCTSKEDMQGKVQQTSTTRKFQAKWLTDFEWLVYDEEKNQMTCKFCVEKPHSAGNTDFVLGCTTFKRESLTAHSKSRRHNLCRESVVCSKSSVEASPIVLGFSKQDERDEEAKLQELSVKMNTAYCIAKEELSFTHMRALVLLQKKNGLNITPTYDNDVRCAELVCVNNSNRSAGKKCIPDQRLQVHLNHD